jgi:hypothetical protein
MPNAVCGPNRLDGEDMLGDDGEDHIVGAS